MNFYFELLCIVHLMVWIFVLLAFTNKRAAEINLYYIIPIIYIAHTLPFHLLTKFKEYAEPEDTKSKIDDYEKNNFLFNNFNKLKDVFSSSFRNPLSPQGLLILGAITSAWALKIDKFYY
jgi:hypothetical protein